MMTKDGNWLLLDAVAANLSFLFPLLYWLFLGYQIGVCWPIVKSYRQSSRSLTFPKSDENGAVCVIDELIFLADLFGSCGFFLGCFWSMHVRVLHYVGHCFSFQGKNRQKGRLRVGVDSYGWRKERRKKSDGSKKEDGCCSASPRLRLIYCIINRYMRRQLRHSSSSWRAHT